MKVKVKNIKELLNEDLGFRERGVLISIMLLKEDDEKVTEAKVKASLKLSNIKEDLIKLHELGYISWRGYKRATKVSKVSEEDVVKAIEFMNQLYGRKFNSKSKVATKNLRARLEEVSLEEVMRVIANRWVRMERYEDGKVSETFYSF